MRAQSGYKKGKRSDIAHGQFCLILSDFKAGPRWYRHFLDFKHANLKQNLTLIKFICRTTYNRMNWILNIKIVYLCFFVQYRQFMLDCSFDVNCYQLPNSNENMAKFLSFLQWLCFLSLRLSFLLTQNHWLSFN